MLNHYYNNDLDKKQVILAKGQASGDFNNILQTGIYRVTYSGNTNQPISSGGVLIVFNDESDNNGIVQLFFTSAAGYKIRTKWGNGNFGS